MKKFIAILLTLSMVLSLFVVPVSANTAGEFDVNGDIVMLDHVFEVTLPTTPFTMVVDPEGVLADNAAGAINFTAGTPSFINRSSAPVRLGIEARITTTSGDTRVAPVATAGDVGTAGDTARSAHISVTPSTENVATYGGVFVGTAANATALTESPTLFTFVIPAANYVIEGTVAADNLRRVMSATPNLQGTQIQLAGRVTPNPAIWTGNEELGVRIRFSFDAATPQQVALPPIANAAHLRTVAAGEVFDTMDVGPQAFNATVGVPIALPVAQTYNVTGIRIGTIGSFPLAGPGGWLTHTGGNVNVTFSAGAIGTHVIRIYEGGSFTHHEFTVTVSAA